MRERKPNQRRTGRRRGRKRKQCPKKKEGRSRTKQKPRKTGETRAGRASRREFSLNPHMRNGAISFAKSNHDIHYVNVIKITLKDDCQ